MVEAAEPGSSAAAGEDAGSVAQADKVGHSLGRVVAVDRVGAMQVELRKTSQTSHANEDRSMRLSPSVASWARHSPMAAECLNPWPEQGEATITRGVQGSRSITKRLSGATV